MTRGLALMVLLFGCTHNEPLLGRDVGVDDTPARQIRDARVIDAAPPVALAVDPAQPSTSAPLAAAGNARRAPDGTACALDADCSKAHFCDRSARCVRGCEVHGECGVAERCDPHGRCLPETARPDGLGALEIEPASVDLGPGLSSASFIARIEGASGPVRVRLTMFGADADAAVLRIETPAGELVERLAPGRLSRPLPISATGLALRFELPERLDPGPRQAVVTMTSPRETARASIRWMGRRSVLYAGDVQIVDPPGLGRMSLGLQFSPSTPPVLVGALSPSFSGDRQVELLAPDGPGPDLRFVDGFISDLMGLPVRREVSLLVDDPEPARPPGTLVGDYREAIEIRGLDETVVVSGRFMLRPLPAEATLPVDPRPLVDDPDLAQRAGLRCDPQVDYGDVLDDLDGPSRARCLLGRGVCKLTNDLQRRREALNAPTPNIIQHCCALDAEEEVHCDECVLELADALGARFEVERYDLVEACTIENGALVEGLDRPGDPARAVRCQDAARLICGSDTAFDRSNARCPDPLASARELELAVDAHAALLGGGAYAANGLLAEAARGVVGQHARQRAAERAAALVRHAATALFSAGRWQALWHAGCWRTAPPCQRPADPPCDGGIQPRSCPPEAVGRPACFEPAQLLISNALEVLLTRWILTVDAYTDARVQLLESLAGDRSALDPESPRRRDMGELFVLHALSAHLLMEQSAWIPGGCPESLNCPLGRVLTLADDRRRAGARRLLDALIPTPARVGAQDARGGTEAAFNDLDAALNQACSAASALRSVPADFEEDTISLTIAARSAARAVDASLTASCGAVNLSECAVDQGRIASGFQAMLEAARASEDALNHLEAIGTEAQISDARARALGFAWIESVDALARRLTDPAQTPVMTRDVILRDLGVEYVDLQVDRRELGASVVRGPDGAPFEAAAVAAILSAQVREAGVRLQIGGGYPARLLLGGVPATTSAPESVRDAIARIARVRFERPATATPNMPVAWPRALLGASAARLADLRRTVESGHLARAVGVAARLSARIAALRGESIDRRLADTLVALHAGLEEELDRANAHLAQAERLAHASVAARHAVIDRAVRVESWIADARRLAIERAVLQQADAGELGDDYAFRMRRPPETRELADAVERVDDAMWRVDEALRGTVGLSGPEPTDGLAGLEARAACMTGAHRALLARLGPPTADRLTLSARCDLLGICLTRTDSVTGEPIEPGERFRQRLRRLQAEAGAKPIRLSFAIPEPDAVCGAELKAVTVRGIGAPLSGATLRSGGLVTRACAGSEPTIASWGPVQVPLALDGAREEVLIGHPLAGDTWQLVLPSTLALDALDDILIDLEWVGRSAPAAVTVAVDCPAPEGSACTE